MPVSLCCCTVRCRHLERDDTREEKGRKTNRGRLGERPASGEERVAAGSPGGGLAGSELERTSGRTSRHGERVVGWKGKKEKRERTSRASDREKLIPSSADA